MTSISDGVVMPDTVEIDFVARGEDPDRYLLVLVEQGPWNNDYNTRLQRLQEKLYACVDAVSLGSIIQRFPGIEGNLVEIRVDAYGVENERIAPFFEAFSKGVVNISPFKEALDEKRWVDGIFFTLNVEQ